MAVTGVVRTPDGEPVSEARVYFTGGPQPFPDIAALTDAEGRFVLDLPGPGAYEIESVADGYAPARATVEAAAGGEVEVDLRLSTP